jgi:hypothetical protein
MRFIEPALQRAGVIPRTIVETFWQARAACQLSERHSGGDTRRGRERMKATPPAAGRGQETHVRRGLRHLRRAINWTESAIPEAGEDTMARETSRAVFACVSILLLAAVTGCSEFGQWGKPDKPVDPNVYPANYKKDVLAYVKAHPAEMLNAREASISAPALTQFGGESRFFACLRVNGPDWRKDKMLIFYSGGINQFIDAESGQCGAAPYQPFPELVTEISQLKGKK